MMGMAKAEPYSLKDGTEKWRGRYFCPDWTWCAPALEAGRSHCKGHVDRLSGFDNPAAAERAACVQSDRRRKSA
jgi:hypothetical protein